VTRKTSGGTLREEMKIRDIRNTMKEKKENAVWGEGKYIEENWVPSTRTRPYIQKIHNRETDVMWVVRKNNGKSALIPGRR